MSEIENKKIENKKIEKIKFDSKIINNIDEVIFIIKQLIAKYSIEKLEYFNSILLYRATRDGDDHNSFYNKVENKRKTLSIVKTTKGVRFGCYLDIAIKSSNGEYIDKINVLSLV